MCLSRWRWKISTFFATATANNILFIHLRFFSYDQSTNVVFVTFSSSNVAFFVFSIKIVIFILALFISFKIITITKVFIQFIHFFLSFMFSTIIVCYSSSKSLQIKTFRLQWYKNRRNEDFWKKRTFFLLCRCVSHASIVDDQNLHA